MSLNRNRLGELLKEYSLRFGHFTLSGGETSDVYLDVKSTSLLGEGAFLLGELLVDELVALERWPRGVGGLTLGADPLVAAMGISAYRRELDLAAVICRKEVKGHGMQRALEHPPTLGPGDQIVAIDDVVTSGVSTLQAVQAMRGAGFEIQDALCVVDREAGGREALEREGVRLHALFTLNELRQE